MDSTCLAPAAPRGEGGHLESNIQAALDVSFRITTSLTTLWINAAHVDDAIASVLGREPVRQANALSNGWTVLAVDNDKHLTLPVAAAIAEQAHAELLRVRLNRSRRLRIEHLTNAGTLVGEARWPERDGRSPLLAPEQWPAGAIAEPVLEHLATQLGIPTAWATVPPRGWTRLGFEPRTIAPVEVEPIVRADGPAARITQQLHASGPLAALLVLEPGARLTPLQADGIRTQIWPASARWGQGGREQISVRADPGADPSASEAITRWISDSAEQLVQAIIHRSAWDPLLQVDATPWEIAWRLPPMQERRADWPEHQIRGASDSVVLGAALSANLGDPPDGSRRDGPLIHRGDAAWTTWCDWLAPDIQSPGGHRYPADGK